MRNWNHMHHSELPLLEFCFQTTYEELKLLFNQRIESAAKSLASRLPMRNWNSCRQSRACSMISASRLPMRNWNLERLEMHFSISTRLPDYLWGIETTSRKQSLWVDRREGGFQTTYEELKLVSKQLYPVFRPRFQTTYEELKPIDETLTRWGSTPASRLPMRNWNKASKAGACLSHLSSFQTTYEELKPVASLVASHSHTGFQTTYEELKLLSGKLRTKASASSFQTTYEELKPDWAASSYDPESASRLPMRNWNSRSWENCDSRTRASRLPMRNWNFGGNPIDEAERAASRLPMRNWN